MFINYKKALLLSLFIFISIFTYSTRAFANFPPQSATGTIGLQGTISSSPPTTAATIVTPVTGSSFTSTPITVTGLCPKGLLVKLFANNVFDGSVYCSSGSYSLQISLFPGTDDLVARVYDSLNQAGPDSNLVVVTFSDIATAKYGSRVSLTSNYAEIGVNPGSTLTWPIIVSQGNPPYAISVDWGDGSPSSLISDKTPGTLNISHVYSTSGVYNIVIKATDSNGTTAYLQVIGIANGAALKNGSSKTANTIIETKVLWWPAVAMVPLILAAFWVGRRHELFSLRKNMERSRSEDAKRF